MLAAPNEQRLADAIDTVAAAAIGAGARLTDLTTLYIDEEKSGSSELSVGDRVLVGGCG